jgi:hypothetical protein
MLKAKTVMPNKFWILEDHQGLKQGTVSIQPNVIKVVINNVERTYDNLEKACWDLAINVGNESTIETIPVEETVLDYPTKCAAYNPTWDIKKKIPVFTKTEKSRTLHAAGYYIINFDTGWVQSFCPKVSTLDSNEFKGPFKDKLEMREQLRIMNNASDIN